MGNLELDVAFQALARSELDQAAKRGASRYGTRDRVAPLPTGQGRWYLLQTTPLEEKLAAGGLIGRGFDAYLPILWKKERVGQGGLREIARPMFPSYLFLRCLPVADHRERVRNVPGVHGFVAGMITHDGHKGDDAIDAIQLAEAKWATRAGKKALRWNFGEGDEVRILNGPFAYLFGVLISDVDDRGRIEALIDILGRQTCVEIEADDVEKM